MFYPSVKISGKIHGVYDELNCMCGLQFRNTIPKKSEELYKAISFISITKINCKVCKERILNMNFNKSIQDES